ncbi:MAG: hypothetical protein FJ035_00710 [Chloroflexi bacterium]|nr:hypothetical protein [Chloroflexota bacterium]
MPAAAERRSVTLLPHPLFHRVRQPLLAQLVIAPGAASAEPVARDTPELRMLAPEGGRPEPPAGQVLVRRASRRMLALGLSLLPEKGGRAVRHVPAFRDERVRRAVALALDRARLLDLYDGAASGPIGPAHAQDALSATELARHPLYAHRPDEARALLAAAGHKGLAFAFETSTRAPIRGVGEAIAEQLRAAGFAPALRVLPPADCEALVHTGDFEAGLVELDAMRTPDVGLRLHMAGGCSGTFSWWGYSAPAFDIAARQAFAELDPRRRAERSRAAQRELLRQVPALLPISAQHDYVLLPPNLRGYDFDAFEFNEGWLASRWFFDPPANQRA